MNADKVNNDIAHEKRQDVGSEIDRWCPLILSASIGVHRRPISALDLGF
jgi:hypothetical protein